LAKRNLEGQIDFGFLEDFDGGLEAIRRACEFGIPQYQDLNCGKQGYQKRLLTADLEAEILLYNALDQELWSYAKQLFALRQRQLLEGDLRCSETAHSMEFSLTVNAQVPDRLGTAWIPRSADRLGYRYRESRSLFFADCSGWRRPRIRPLRPRSLRDCPSFQVLRVSLLRISLHLGATSAMG